MAKSLPPELEHHLLKFLLDDIGYMYGLWPDSTDGYGWNYMTYMPATRYEAFKHVALVCKRFYKWSIPALYATVVLTPDNFDRFIRTLSDAMIVGPHLRKVKAVYVSMQDWPLGRCEQAIMQGEFETLFNTCSGMQTFVSHANPKLHADQINHLALLAANCPLCYIGNAFRSVLRSSDLPQLHDSTPVSLFPCEPKGAYMLVADYQVIHLIRPRIGTALDLVTSMSHFHFTRLHDNPSLDNFLAEVLQSHSSTLTYLRLDEVEFPSEVCLSIQSCQRLKHLWLYRPFDLLSLGLFNSLPESIQEFFIIDGFHEMYEILPSLGQQLQQREWLPNLELLCIGSLSEVALNKELSHYLMCLTKSTVDISNITENKAYAGVWAEMNELYETLQSFCSSRGVMFHRDWKKANRARINVSVARHHDFPLIYCTVILVRIFWLLFTSFH